MTRMEEVQQALESAADDMDRMTQLLDDLETLQVRPVTARKE